MLYHTYIDVIMVTLDTFPKKAKEREGTDTLIRIEDLLQLLSCYK